MDPKYDRLYAAVDLSRIRGNLKNIKSSLAKGTGIIAVLKADAYGHGSRVVANYISDDIEMAGVAGVSEALELRKEMEGGKLYSPCFTKPILVLGYSHPSMFEDAIANDVTLTVFDEANAKELDKAARKAGKPADVHIAVDTGMHRIGFRPTDESVEAIRRISKLKNLRIKGIFSHFARADETAGVSETDEQEKRFRSFCDKLSREGIDAGIRHISNSAAIMTGRTDYPLVRAGIVLYGNYPSGEMNKDLIELQPSLSVRARIVNVAALEKGESVSYGHTFTADKKMKIATLAAGYADGIFRSLSNKGEVVISGKRCRILGRICMDQMMADVTEVENCSVGDEALIFGELDGAVLPIEEVAAKAGSFNYELMCEIGRRMARIYYENGMPVETVNYI
ncbi:MAG: alanine racemase [Clostridia bacterium]|nr:alanine racemase [Clostridia bacterium]